MVATGMEHLFFATLPVWLQCVCVCVCVTHRIIALIRQSICLKTLPELKHVI